MEQKIQSQLDNIRNIVSVLPTNNKENREKKARFIEEEEMKLLAILSEVEKELKKRIGKLEALTEDTSLSELAEELKKCSILNEWNKYNTSYEKIHLDYYLYQLHRYYRNDLVNTNDCIRRIIKAFSDVGIELTKEDFNIHPYVAEYVGYIQANMSEEELNAKFEPLYWKLPDLIKTIEINFKYIYLKYEKKIDKYFENRHNEFLKTHTDKELIDRKKELIKMINNKREKDKFYIYNKFKNREYNLNDYEPVERNKKRSLYFGEMEYTFDFLLELYQVLYDYNLILKYEYVLDDIKNLLGNIATLKNSKAEALKKVMQTEKELIKVSGTEKKKKFFFSKKEENPRNLIKFKELLTRALSEFEEYDKACFNDTLSRCYNDEFTAANALELVSANYLYFINMVKEHEQNNDINFLSSKYSELKHEVNNNNFALLDKITLLDEYPMKQVIADKYTLDGAKLTVEQLEKDNIEKTMKDIKTLVNYEYILRSEISLDDVRLNLDMRSEFM